jgi:cephalosporin hydroxylase
LTSYDSEFEDFRAKNLAKQLESQEFQDMTSAWVQKSVDLKYSYNFNWLGVPIIQFPTDLVAFQELVWKVRPTVILECGVARGGSAIFWASMQDIVGINPKVIAVDIEIREHTKNAIRGSKYSESIHIIEGDSTAESTAEKVLRLIELDDIVMVVLDSNHTYDHVLKELENYARLVSAGSYLLVLDTVIEKLKIDLNRPWGPGASPWTAVTDFMKLNSDFQCDEIIEGKVSITVAPRGYWLRVHKT